MKWINSIIILVVAVSFAACSSSDVVTGGLMKRKYRNGLYIAKRGNHIQGKKKFLKEVDRSSNTLMVEVSQPKMKFRDGVMPLLRGSRSTQPKLSDELVESPDYVSLDVTRKLYWLEEDDSPLDNRFLEITLGVLGFLAAIAAFVGLIFGVIELTSIVTGSSSSGMSGTVALAILILGLPIAIAVVWTLVALGVKLIRGE